MNVDQMFPARYLRGQDLAGPILIVITGIGLEKMRAGQGKPEETKYVMRFELAKGNTVILDTTQHPPDGYGLILRKTLARQIQTALNMRDAEKWIGQRVVIFPGPSKAGGDDVITTYARAPARAPKAAQSAAGVAKDAPAEQHQPETAKETA